MVVAIRPCQPQDQPATRTHDRLRALPWAVDLLFVVLLSAATPVASAERCPGAETTLALRECLGRLIEASDRTLARGLEAVAAAARREALEEPFLTRWQQFGEQLLSGPDPARQLRAFQRQRRQICQYVNALSLQGSGFGVFVLSCELDLNEALLLQLRN